MGLFDTIRAHYQVWKFKRSPLGQALRLHTQRYFYSGEALSWMEEKNKQGFIQDFMAQLVAVIQSPEPRMALREKLTEYVNRIQRACRPLP